MMHVHWFYLSLDSVWVSPRNETHLLSMTDLLARKSYQIQWPPTAYFWHKYIVFIMMAT